MVPHHNFAVIAPMVLKFGTVRKLNVFFFLASQICYVNIEYCIDHIKIFEGLLFLSFFFSKAFEVVPMHEFFLHYLLQLIINM